MNSDWNLSLVLAIGELLADPQQPKALLEAKLYAFQQVKGLMCQYEKHGIREDLLDVIFDKKLKLILKAKTASEVKRASDHRSLITLSALGARIPSLFQRRNLHCGRSFRPTTC